MERTTYQASNCSIDRTLQVLGEKWTLLILRESFYGATRFEQFHRVLQCPRNLLSERLTLLVDEGILERVGVPRARQPDAEGVPPDGPGPRADADPDRAQGVGRPLQGRPEGPPVLARHADCGKELHLTLTCAAGHVATTPDEVELVDGPGALPLVPA